MVFNRRHWSIQPRDEQVIRKGLSEAALLEGASEEMVSALSEAAEIVSVRAGATLVREGRIPTHLYVITSGVFDVFSSGESGVETKVTSLQAGEHFGEIGIIEGMPSTASVRADGEAVTVRIPAGRFLDAVRESPELARLIRGRAAQKLAQTHPSYDPAAAQIVIDEVGEGVSWPRSIRRVDELLRSITGTAKELFGAAACSIALLDEATGDLVFRSVTGEGAEEILGARIPAGQGIVGAVMTSGAPVVVPDVATDERFASSFASSFGYQPKTIVARPLEVRGKIVGVIEVLDPDDSHDVASDRLGLFSDQAALAIEAGQALQELVETLSEWTTMSGPEKREAIGRIRDRLGA